MDIALRLLPRIGRYHKKLVVGEAAVKCGDTHNFGLATADCGQWIMKPRMGTWEFLLLSRKSIFRRKLEKILLEFDALSAMPALDFSSKSIDEFGEYFVQKLIWTPLEISSLRQEDFAQLGSIIAINYFLGITDLHRENFVLGHTGSGKFICGPIDIESIFNTVRLPSDTALLPKAFKEDDTRRRACGLAVLFGQVRPFELACLIFGFIESMKLLRQNWQILDDAIRKSVPKNAFVRIIVRNTMDYAVQMQGKNLEHKFAPCELEQMSRGDIPYYFRKLDSRDLQYFCWPHVPGSASPQVLEKYNSDAVFDSCKERAEKMSDSDLVASCFQIMKAMLIPVQDCLTSYRTVEIKMKDGKLIIMIEGKVYQLKD